MAFNLFGFSIKRKEVEDPNAVDSFVPKQEFDGATQVTSAGGAYGTYIDLDGSATTEAQLVTRYREMENHPEVRRAIDDVVNEAIIVDSDTVVVDIQLDDVEISDKIKKTITEEFDNVLRLLDFSNKSYDIFNRFYVDGRLRFHVVIDEENTKRGITELRYIDPRKIKKIREVETKMDPKTGARITKTKAEYYVYTERGFLNQPVAGQSSPETVGGVRIAKDSIAETNSSVMNETNTLVLGYLHQAIKPLNQLKMLEDSSVIYRLARAPERRIFYIDVGTLPKAQAEQYLKEMMTRHKNRMVYDASTGEMRNDKKHMTMLEDFWLPRREGGRGTEISTLPGGTNLGEMDDIIYFQRNLYKALRVPIGRMDPETGFSLGRSTEISRDEVKFSKFIGRIRNQFSHIFDELMGKQLILRNVMTPEEWDDIKDKVRYDFREDNYFQELKEAEVFRDRVATLREMEDLVGTYFSREWTKKNVLRLTEDEIKEMDKEIAKEEPEEEERDEAENGEDNAPPAQTIQLAVTPTQQQHEKERELKDEPKPSPKKEVKKESVELSDSDRTLVEKINDKIDKASEQFIGE